MACPQLTHFLVAAGAAGFSLAFFVFFIAAHSCLVATGCGAVTHPHNWTAHMNVIKFSCRSCSRRPKPSGSVHTRYKPRTKNQVRDRVLSSAWMWATMQLAEKERSVRWCCGATSDVHEMSVKGMIDHSSLRIRVHKRAVFPTFASPSPSSSRGPSSQPLVAESKPRQCKPSKQQ